VVHIFSSRSDEQEKALKKEACLLVMLRRLLLNEQGNYISESQVNNASSALPSP
jgi:hypothetical protein